MDTKISKTTRKMAQRRSLHIETFSDGFEISKIQDGEPCEEFLAFYVPNQDGSFRYAGSCLSGDNDMPALIDNEAKLRSLLDEFATL